MIISASRRTDIPAFYGDWFLNRLRAGYCKTVNPYYNEKVSNVSLKRGDVDGFVFWTKNLGPFMDKLEVVQQLGYPFYIQYTIHHYPRQLESSVVSAERSIKYLKNVAAKYGSRTAVWRYDPIIITSITPREFHIQNFEEIAKELDGSTDEVVISFAHIYKKTLNNMNSASEELGFTWEDPSTDIKLDLAKQLADIAKSYNMKLTTCAQPLFTPPGIGIARCIDAIRLSDVAGYGIRSNLKGNRPDCGCYESIDIGDYDTCPHGCVYCYAVLNRELAKRNHLKHDPNSEYLIPISPQSDRRGRKEDSMSTPRFNAIYDRPGEDVYGELGLNLYTNCSHGCQYCYNKILNRHHGSYNEPRKRATLNNIEHDLRILRDRRDRRPVWLSALCDPYDLGREAPSKPRGLLQYDENHQELKPVGNGYTRAVLEMFRDPRFNHPFTILTKGGMLAAKDFDLYTPQDKFGVTLTFDNDVHSKQYEPGAALPGDRIEALKESHSRGIQTWVSMEPVIYPAQSLHLIEMSHEFVDYYFIEKLNHFPKIEATIDWPKFKNDVEALMQSLSRQQGTGYHLSDPLIDATR